MKKGALAHLARPGTLIAVRVTPRAGRDEVVEADGTLHVRVTAAPEGGKANAAVAKLIAQALGVAKTRLALVKGDTARDKLFRLD